MNDRVAVKATRATRSGPVARGAHRAVQPRPDFPGQVVLVLQGGGALGAYQAGVYEALHEAGVEPDWVIGTSIGAINAALIAGNAPANRFERLQRVLGTRRARCGRAGLSESSPVFGNALGQLTTVMRGHPGVLRAATRGVARLARSARRRGGRLLHRPSRCAQR